MEFNALQNLTALLCFPYDIFYHVTFIVCVILMLFSLLWYLFHEEAILYNKKQKMSLLYFGYMTITEMIYDFILDSIHNCNKKIFSFVMSFFTILFFYNCAGMFPHVEEITKDINVCVAFALYGFFYVHYIAISELGFSQYMHHWTKEIIQKRHFTSKIVTILYQVITIILNIITSILVFPLKLLEIISLLFSLTFRLFGNMFGGSIVISLLHKMQASGILYQLPITLFGIQVIVLLYFSLFEGMIQAFIFTLILLNTLGGFFNHDA